ncbi:MAG: hypothetical protein QW814_02035 [Methanothrix sp.]
MLSQKQRNCEFDVYTPMPAPVSVEIGNKKYLNQSLELKNPREDSVKIALLDLGIPAYYEYMRYPLSNGKVYYPDFITSIYLNGRQVVLEPHSTVNDIGYLKKLNEFINRYNFYLILISNRSYRKLVDHGSDPEKFIDEYWFINNFFNREDSVKQNSEKVKKKLKKLLRNPEAEVIKNSDALLRI